MSTNTNSFSDIVTGKALTDSRSVESFAGKRSASVGMTHDSAFTANSIEEFLMAQIPVSHEVSEGLAYHELAEQPLRSVDLVAELEMNLQRLSQVKNKLQFMNRELRYLLKV